MVLRLVIEFARMNKLLRYLRPVWYLVIIAIFLVALQSLFAMLIPSLIGSITTIIEYPSDYAQRLGTLISIFSFQLLTPTGDGITDIWIVGGIMMGFAFGFLLCAFGSSITISRIGASYGRNLRHDVFSKVNRFAIGQYDKFGTASLITRTTNDIEQTQQLIQSTLRIIIMSPLSMILAIVLVMKSDPLDRPHHRLRFAFHRGDHGRDFHHCLPALQEVPDGHRPVDLCRYAKR